MSTTYGYGIQIPAPAGVDGEHFVVTLGVHHKLGRALTRAEVAALETALAPLAARGLVTVGDPDVARAAESKAHREQSAQVAKVTGAGRKPTSKGKAPSKTTAGKPRKASKATVRKAARRPAKG